MSAIAIEQPRARTLAVRRGIGRGVLFLLVLAALWGLWEGYRALWIHEQWTWPFVVDDERPRPLLVNPDGAVALPHAPQRREHE